jgi:hypothetical protein
MLKHGQRLQVLMVEKFSINGESKMEENNKTFIVAKEGYKPMMLLPEKLKEMVSNAEIKGDDLIFHESIKVWTRARFVKGLRSLIAKLEASSTAEGEDSDEDFLDDLLDESGVSEEEIQNKSHPENSKKSELPPILAAVVAARNENNNGSFHERAVNDALNQSLGRMGLRDIASSDRYPEIKLPPASEVKKYVQYGIIGCFLLLLLYYFYPRSKGEATMATEYIHGKISMDGEPLKIGSIVVKGPDGKEVFGYVEPGGTYKVENPPLGKLKFKFFATPVYHMYVKGQKKEDNKKTATTKFETFDNDIGCEYQGGRKHFDLSLISK